MKNKKKLWHAYIMAGNTKLYLRKGMTTIEAVNWLKAKCTMCNGEFFMCNQQVFCEQR